MGYSSGLGEERMHEKTTEKTEETETCFSVVSLASCSFKPLIVHRLQQPPSAEFVFGIPKVSDARAPAIERARSQADRDRCRRTRSLPPRRAVQAPGPKRRQSSNAR